MSHIKISATVKLLLLLLCVSAADANEITLESLNLGRVKDSEQKILKNFSGYYSGSAQLDANGWSVLTPSKDSRLVYVSYSGGSDQAGKVYKRSEIADLGSPGTISEFKTIQNALKHIRRGYPDYLLLKRGDSWLMESSIVLKGGRSSSERMVLMAYGDQNERPKIKSTTTAVKIFGSASSVAIIGMDIYADNRDPGSTKFAGWGSVLNDVGIKVYSKTGTIAGSILVENCIINFFSTGITLTGGAKFQDIVVRRNSILNSYSEKSHSQGLFALNSSILLEENLFDHNGWFKQKERLAPKKKYGQATKFNHNTYFSDANNSVMRNNIFLRASSAHNKWASNSKSEKDTINTENVIVRNNFYYAGEIGISAGGNKDRDTGPRWRNIFFIDNIMTGIGREQPTNRTLGWYFDIDDWDTGIVCGNYLLSTQNKDVTNLLGISIKGHSSNIVVSHNKISGLVTDGSDRAAISIARGPVEKVTIAFNSIQLENSSMRVMTIKSNRDNLIGSNTYFSGAPANKWFRLGRNNLNFDGWKSETSDKGSQVKITTKKNPARDFTSYLASAGISSIDQFVDRFPNKDGNPWPGYFSAGTMNDYLRQPSGNQKCPISM